MTKRQKDRQKRHSQRVGHIKFETIVDRNGLATFGLHVGDDLNHKKPLFSGVVVKGMGSELRRLAAHFDDIERNLEKEKT